MYSSYLVLISLLLPISNYGQISEIIGKLNSVADFTLDHYKEINFDGMLGFVIAEAQLRHSLPFSNNWMIQMEIIQLLEKCEEIRARIIPNLPYKPKKMPVLAKYLLNIENWMLTPYSFNNSLLNFGIYHNWTAKTIIDNHHAIYKGVPSDHCLIEILAFDCYVSSSCEEMMLSERIDNGYLLTHRLLYLQVARLKRCSLNIIKFEEWTNWFCSLILKEARTNQFLEFPAYDIFLEQMVLCGIEGNAEFLVSDWSKKVIEWQTPFGCYKRLPDSTEKRSTNLISFGCTDHTTGLGAAALALNLRFLLQKRANKIMAQLY